MLPLARAQETIPEVMHQAEPGGYCHELYARSFGELGNTVFLSRSRGMLLRRAIPHSNGLCDYISHYPLFACEQPDLLGADLATLPENVVSTAIVSDPIRGPTVQLLKDAFDIVTPFKMHYLIDLTVPFSAYLRTNHRRNARRALARSSVTEVANAAQYTEEWVGLYRHLIVRHNIQGFASFSDHSLALQLKVPGCHYFRAVMGGQVVGAFVCFLDRGIAYSHLISTTCEGHRHGIQYGLYWTAIEALRDQARWFVLGGTPGVTGIGGSKGLEYFKAGWATHANQNYFCGRVHRPVEYRLLRQKNPHSEAEFFPAYRSARE